MRSFADAAGRIWIVSITVADVRRVRALCGVDLYGLVDDGLKPLGALLGDPVKLCDVLCCLSADAEGQRPLSESASEDFGRALAGDSLQAATDAFVEALVDFFPKPQREGLKKVLAKGTEIAQRARALGEKRLASLDVETMVAQIADQAGRPWSGNSPDAPGSTPTP